MKKVMVVFFLAALPALLFGQHFSVTSPMGGEKWVVGSPHPITWTFSGIPGTTKVRLMLFHNGTKVGNIAESLAVGTGGLGSYAWQTGAYIGGTAPAGDGYTVRIRDMNNQYPMAESPAAFTILAGLHPEFSATKAKVPILVQHPIHCQGTLIMPLNSYMDLDSGHLITVVSGTDFWWSQNSIAPYQRVLIPNGGAKFKTLGVMAQYTYQSLRSEAYTYSDTLIPESALVPNMVVGYITGEMRSGAFRVVGIGTNGELSIAWVTYEN